MNDSRKAISDEESLKNLRSEKSILVDQTLEHLYIANFPIIQNFIKKNNGNDADAADIFQNAMVVFYKKARTSKFELRCSIQTYVYSICRNLWLDELRAKKKQQNLVTELESIPVEIEELWESKSDERIDLILKLMAEIGADCKKLLGLYYFERLRMKQIAEVMNYSNEKVAKNLKARCIKKLRTLAKQNSK